ncbi:DNA internalization-related competence protein ComEC/Rec2 [Limnobacter parvus]|uniref:DNA internalization-related competence protein ComEC/Rec2 n=1 Tax=Limnobacter parvus TaxID=2939690 RepID=A0ABT1XGR2_9BURK|nr:DNA internalization-related competence protein ComEC/Rec2 [Limnobacter parvus]MCR2746486.1 DNA internalization-related competence protein ComEC/Rec2 [Limnobacter parvus]
MCKSQFALALWLFAGFGAAQLNAGVQAAAHKNMQVPLACNKQQVQSEFKLLEKAFRDDGAQTWLIMHKARQSNTPEQCLKNGAKIQMFVESANRFESLKPGQAFQATLRLKPPKGTLQLEGFDVHRHWFANQIAGTAQLKSDLVILPDHFNFNPLVWLERARLHTAEWIVSSLQNHPEQALVLAMVVGDQGLISAEDRELFNSTGIAHLVAISGLHITLFAMIAGKGMGLLWRRSQRLCLSIPAPLAGSAFGLLFAVLYGLVAGWGVPAQRTVFMLFALFVGQLRGGTQNSWDTFFLALFLTLAFDSWAVLDAGFLLSFGAVGTLIFVTQGHYHFIKPQQEFIANAVKAQYTVTVGLILPCAMLFNQQSLISPVANALSIPWMSFVSTPLALLGGLLQQNWALVLAANSLALQREWLVTFNELSWATLPLQNQPFWINLLVALGCIILIMPQGIVSRWFGLALVALLAWPAPRPAEQDFWLTLMDVAQGTAIAVQTKNHLLIYDAGPAFNDRSNSARRVLLPWMAAHGYNRADLFMLSHDDADHSGGAPLLIEKAPPRQFASSMVESHPLNQLATQKQSEIKPCHSMEKWTWNGVAFQPIGLHTPTRAHNNLWTKNNQSCVLKISNSSHSVLLTGDIEAIAEMHLLAQHGADHLKARVIVVPHHGSKTSSTLPFLQAVRPEIALIQSGWQNQFGHPHSQVIERYESMNVKVHNTAQNGAMKWVFPNSKIDPFATKASEIRQTYWHAHESGAKAP